MFRRFYELARTFVRDEVGANYTMQLTMALPFYVLFVATLIETTLTLNAKIGVTHAAYAAARAATVWWPADDLGTDDPEIKERRKLGRIHLAAVNALAPFASGQPEHAGRINSSFKYSAEAPQGWAKTYLTAGGDHDVEYLQAKWQYAAGATRIFVQPLEPNRQEEKPLTKSQDEHTFNSALRVVVEYDMPFQTPGVGRLFGVARGNGLYTRTIRSSVVLEKEGPKTEDFRLGFKNYYEVESPREVFESKNTESLSPYRSNAGDASMVQL